jgi:Flp pilus assembly protein TadD
LIFLGLAAVAGTILLTPLVRKRRARHTPVAALPGGEADGGALATGGVALLERGSEPEDELTAYARADREGDPGAAFMLGGLLWERGDLEGAIAALRRAADRGHAAGASNLGVLLEQQGDLDGALEAYRRATERGDPDGAFNLGALLAERGDVSGAAAAFRLAEARGQGEVVTQARSALYKLRGWHQR